MAENYCTLAEVKASLDETLEANDAQIERQIGAASRAIEQTTGKLYYATSATRYYRTGIYGKMLLLDADLLAVTTLTNGDGVVILGTEYWLAPRNSGPPYRGIELKSTKFWNLSTADAEISVAGSWGSASAPPDNVRSACVLIAVRLYRRPDAPFGILGGSEVSQAVYIAKNDPDVKLLLEGENRKQGLW